MNEKTAYQALSRHLLPGDGVDGVLRPNLYSQGRTAAPDLPGVVLPWSGPGVTRGPRIRDEHVRPVYNGAVRGITIRTRRTRAWQRIIAKYPNLVGLVALCGVAAGVTELLMQIKGV